MTGSSVLGAGLADPVHDCQRLFRAAMEALARPGSLQPLAGLPEPPAPLSPAAAALALTLADHETPLWLDAPLAASAAVAAYLRFHTGARLVTDPAAASFALISDPAALPPLATFAQGSLEYPDRSTTLILQLGELAAGRGLRLQGPGIADAAHLAAAPLPGDFVERMAANRALFPRGVDLLLAAGDAVAGLPRTTVVTA